jgi:alkanesulfonate monooxygenase SsuD/methylene tetrahydromethanopterin reductase-like flavin-dependent oxidoreductase (luciferase family)
MRLGLVLEPGPDEVRGHSLVRQAAAADELGLDLVWLAAGGAGGAPLAAAASLARATHAVRIAAAVPVGVHPLRIAEDAAVADNLVAGRLVLVLESSIDDGALVADTADVLLSAFCARPFSYSGSRWTIPAGRPENERTEQRVRVTPPPAQLELPIWLSGHGSAAAATNAVARERGLTHVSSVQDSAESAAEAWAATEAHLGRAMGRLRRPALRRLDTSQAGDFDPDELVARLRAERDAWGLDVVVLLLPAELGARARVSAQQRLARLVRPRVQMDELPQGLEEHWQQTLAVGGETEVQR